MNKLLLTALLILGLSGVSFAYTAVNTGKFTPSYQKSTGLNTVNGGQGFGYETTQATIITGVSVFSGSSANTVEIWDANPTQFNQGNPSVQGSSSVVFEAGAAANTTQFDDFSNTPIRTVNGIESAQSGVTSGNYIIYTVQYP